MATSKEGAWSENAIERLDESAPRSSHCSPSSPKVICDFFIDRDDVEYIVEVYTTDEGFAEEYGVYVLQDDGTKGESVEPDDFDDEVQKKFWGWATSDMDDGRDSYPTIGTRGVRATA